MSTSDRKPGEVDADTHHKIVSMFHDPGENSDTMAWIPKSQARAIGVGVSHFDGRAKRNASILRYWDNVLRLTRSEEGQGSNQMASVAGRPVAPAAQSAIEALAGAGKGSMPSAIINVHSAASPNGSPK